MSTSKKFTLKSSDGEVFEVEEAVAMQSETIKRLFHDCVNEDIHIIPLDNVTSKMLTIIIDYCKKHAESSADGDNEDNNIVPDDQSLKDWDADFVKKFDQNTLFDIILAANYMEVKGLLDLACQIVADSIKGKTPDEIRKTFNLKDFTPEEEEEIRRENQWAFE